MGPRHPPAAHFGLLAAVVAFSATLFFATSARADGFKWPQPDGLGTPVVLTYSFSNLLDGSWPGLLDVAEIRASTAEAFGLWSRYAPLQFVERQDSGPAPSDWQYAPSTYPDIRIGFHPIDEAGVLAHAFLPWDTDESGLAGDIHFNAMLGVTWTVGGGFPTIDFLEVMTHEIGHAIGLTHIWYADAIMQPYHGYRYHGPGTGFLLAPDILAVRALYGTGVGSVRPIPEPSAVAPRRDGADHLHRAAHASPAHDVSDACAGFPPLRLLLPQSGERPDSGSGVAADWPGSTCSIRPPAVA